MVEKDVIGNAYIDTGEVSIYINGKAYDSNLYYLRFKERMNEVPLIEGNFFDIANDNTDLNEKNNCYIKANGSNVSPLFLINKSKPLTDTFRDISGVGDGEKHLSNFTVENTTSEDIDSQSGRPQYSGVAINTIVSEQMSTNTTGITQGTISNNVVNVRSENDTYLSFFAGLADVGGVDWYCSYSSDFATKYINITTRGTDKSGSITLAMSGANQNCAKTERKKDFESLKNVIKLFGYGDGVNQKESYAEHSTSVRSKLTTAINTTDTSITLDDATDFGTSGNVWIGCEKCSYTGKTTNTLTGLTRGVDFRGNVDKAYSHSINSPVTDAQYDSDNAQSTGDGSSINTHGEIQKTFNSRNVIDQSTLDILADKLLIERKGIGTNYESPERILANPTDYNWALANIGVGDQVTITDVDTNLNGIFRCYGREFVYDIENGITRVELEFSNTTFSVLNEISKEQQESVALQKYMQGSTNIFAINETDNVESGTDDHLGLTMFFNIPEDAVAINSVKLSYRNEAPKTWSSNSSNNLTSSSGGVESSTSDYGVNIELDDIWRQVSIYPTSNDEVNFYYVNSTAWSVNWSSSPSGSLSLSPIRFRVKNNETGIYYPSSDGVYLSLPLDDWYTSYGSTMIIIPNEVKGDNLILQCKGKMEDTGTQGNFAQCFVNYSWTRIDSHSHSISYDLTQQVYTTSDIRIWTSDDASGIPSWTERTATIEAESGTLNASNNGSENNLDLTSFFSNPGWKGIKITTNGNSRIKAQTVIKCFIQSRVK